VNNRPPSLAIPKEITLATEVRVPMLIIDLRLFDPIVCLVQGHLSFSLSNSSKIIRIGVMSLVRGRGALFFLPNSCKISRIGVMSSVQGRTTFFLSNSCKIIRLGVMSLVDVAPSSFPIPAN